MTIGYRWQGEADTVKKQIVFHFVCEQVIVFKYYKILTFNASCSSYNLFLEAK